MSRATEKFNAALAELIREQSDERVRQAYERGYNAGVKGAEVDRISYRRGYLAGYWARRRGAAPEPDGTDAGRPRRERIAA